MKKQFLVGLFSLLTVSLSAQYEEPYGGPINVPESTNNEESDVIDGVYVKTIVPSRSMVRYEHVRESDVVWSRRVWSYIDLREKINHPLYFPMDTIITNKMDGTTDWVLNTDRLSLWSILRRHILSSDITIYALCHPMDIDEARKDGDSFKYPIRPEAGLNYETDTVFRNKVDEKLALVSQRIAPLLDADGEPRFEIELDPVSGEEITKYLDTIIKENDWYVSKNIIQYKLKEDWFFDKERSVLDVRILGIAPVVYDGLKSGGKYKELFWLYFPHLRPYLSRYYTYNEQNDAQWMSFDDLFFKRRFNAVMYKESNVYDRTVESYRMGADALMEADKIKEKIRTLEHDVWNF